MADVFSYGGKPGAYLQLTGPEGLGVDIIVPYTSDFSFTASQDTVKPVQELFQFLGDTLTTAAGKIQVIGSAVELANALKTAFGVQFYNKKYYAQAWAGGKPISFSLNIPFSIGGLGVWNGKTEVLDPINKIVKATLPYEGVFLTSPMPNGLSVFAAYGDAIITGALNLLGKDNTRAYNQPGLWSIRFGLLAPQGRTLTTFLVLTELIVKSVTPSYSTAQLDDKGNPIKGSVTLSIESQSIPTSSLFDGNK